MPKIKKEDFESRLRKLESLQSLDKRCDGDELGSSRVLANSSTPLFRVNEPVSAVFLPEAAAVKLPTAEGPVPQLSSNVVPKWYKFFERKELKKKLVKQRLDEYAAPVVITDKVTFIPSVKEIQDYEKQLSGLSIDDLQLMGSLKKHELKLDVLDRIKSFNKKKHAVVTIFNDNETTDTGVIHCYDRTFSRGKMTYIVMSHRGRYDPEFKMQHFYYFANVPFPIEFKKGKLPEGCPDSSLLDSTIEMKVIEALANIQMTKIINLLLIIGLLAFIINIANLLVTLRGFKII